MAYLFVSFYQKIEAKEKIDTWENMCIIAFSSAFTLLTGYFSVVYVGFVAIGLLIKSYIEKQNSNIAFLVASFLLPFIIACAFYCQYFEGFMSYQGTAALQKMGNGFLENLIASSFSLLSIFLRHLFYKIVLLICFVVIVSLLWINRNRITLKAKIASNRMILFLLFISFLWVCITIFFVQVKEARYISSVFPILSLSIPYIFSKGIKIVQQKSLMVIYLLIYFVLALQPGRIEYLYSGVAQKQVFNQKPDIPVIMNNPTFMFISAWPFVDLLPFLSDAQQYEFAKTDEKIIEKINKYDEVFVIVTDEIGKNKEKDALFIDNQYKIEDKFKVMTGLGYLLVRTRDDIAKPESR
jgi:hypothetical protein